MLTISAGEFKAKCLKLMDLVAQNHEEYIITKRGIPVAKMIPIETIQNPFGYLAHTVSYSEDLSRCTIDEPWEADL